MRIYIICIVMLLTGLSTAFAHKEPTHQYFIVQAYELLKKQFGGPIPIMDDYVGTTQGRGCTPDGSPFAFQCPYIVAGAWNEDHQDPIFNQRGDIMVSTSHFWRVDAGRDALVNLTKGFISIASDATNAYQKANIYLNNGGAYDVWYMAPDGTCGAFRYSSLVDFFVNGNVYSIATFRLNTNGIPVNIVYTPANQRSTTFEQMFGLTTLESRRGIAFNILGRIAHLLGDMSVPAHVHDQQHGCPKDIFEEAMNVDYGQGQFPRGWNADNVFGSQGGFLDVTRYCNSDPLYMLMYTTAEVSDHYADWNHNGNDAIDNTYAELNYVFNYGNLGDPRYQYQYSSHYNWNLTCGWYDGYIDVLFGACNCPDVRTDYVEDIRDHTEPFVIRATAGLLYWFAQEAGMLSANCSQALYLQDLRLNSWYTFLAGDIYVGTHVDPDLSHTQGPVTHIWGADNSLILRASNSVQFKNGVHVVNTHAYIAPCSQSDCGGGSIVLNGGGNSGSFVNTPSMGGERLSVPQNSNFWDNDSMVVILSVKDGSGSDDFLLNENSAVYSHIVGVEPNPASGLVRIQYQVVRQEPIRLVLYDLKGRMVREVVNQPDHQQGKFDVLLDAALLTSGTYRLTIQTSERMESVSLVVTK